MSAFGWEAVVPENRPIERYWAACGQAAIGTVARESGHAAGLNSHYQSVGDSTYGRCGALIGDSLWSDRNAIWPLCHMTGVTWVARVESATPRFPA